jgi:hypothetical protein
MQKNLSLIKKLAGKNGEIIKEITISSGDLESLTKKISAEIKSKKISEQLITAQKISKFLRKEFSGIKARFDLFGDHKSSYHSEISFDVFCGDFSYPIARGGRYKINEMNAVGATIYMNRLRKI